jgi:hypothetical protein
MDLTDLSLPANKELFAFKHEKPNYPVFIPGFVTAMIFLCLSLVFAANYSRFGFIAFLIATVFTSIPVAAEFFKNQLRGLSLTRDYLDISRGNTPETARIALGNIARVEVVEQAVKASQSREHRTVVFDKDNRTFGPEAKCVIHTTGGQRISLDARYFPPGGFGQFMAQLEQARKAHQESLAQNPYHSLPATSPAEEKINQVARDNFNLLQEDLRLRQAIEDSMEEAYRALYRVRDGFDLEKMVGQTVVYQFKRDTGELAYILQDDYLPELDEETREIGQNLIEAAQKNLALLSTRIDYYQKIDRELDRLRTREANRRKLQGVAEKLRDLQEKNTNKSLEQSLASELVPEQQVLEQLEELSQRVAGINDLEESQVLKEYISLFGKP